MTNRWKMRFGCTGAARCRRAGWPLRRISDHDTSRWSCCRVRAPSRRRRRSRTERRLPACTAAPTAARVLHSDRSTPTDFTPAHCWTIIYRNTLIWCQANRKRSPYRQTWDTTGWICATEWWRLSDSVDFASLSKFKQSILHIDFNDHLVRFKCWLLVIFMSKFCLNPCLLLWTTVSAV